MEASIEIKSLLGEEKIALKQLDIMLEDSGCCEEDGMDIKTALAEACINAIEHGNGLNPDLGVTVHIHVIGDEVTIEVCDQGKGAELKALTGSGKNTEMTRGRGLYFIDKLVDQWKCYHNPESQLFCLKMKKVFRKGK